ncbi:unnamed protein product, partial [Iphiclides podalirius]
MSGVAQDTRGELFRDRSANNSSGLVFECINTLTVLYGVAFVLGAQSKLKRRTCFKFFDSTSEYVNSSAVFRAVDGLLRTVDHTESEAALGSDTGSNAATKKSGKGF